MQVDFKGHKIWCPPAFLASMRGESFPMEGHVQTKPYWITGPKCTPQCCGPDLTDEEISNLKESWDFILIDQAAAQ